MAKRRKSSKRSAQKCAKAWRLGKGNFCARRPTSKKPKCGFKSLSAAKHSVGIR